MSVADKLNKCHDIVDKVLSILRRHGSVYTDTYWRDLAAALPDPGEVAKLEASTDVCDQANQQAATLVSDYVKLKQQRDELAAALERIRNHEHESDCGMQEHGVSPGGHECSCPAIQANAALKRVGADA